MCLRCWRVTGSGNRASTAESWDSSCFLWACCSGVEDEISAGDRVAVHWMLRGTHTGLFLGNRPASRSIVVQVMIFAHIENGRIVEHWTLLDQMSMLQ